MVVGAFRSSEFFSMSVVVPGFSSAKIDLLVNYLVQSKLEKGRNPSPTK